MYATDDIFQIEIGEFFLYIEKGDIAFWRKGDAEVVGCKAEGTWTLLVSSPDLRHDACMAEDAVGDLPDALLRVGEDELLLCGQRRVEKEVRKDRVWEQAFRGEGIVYSLLP